MEIDYSKIVDDLLDVEDGLTKWEIDFIESLADQKEDAGINWNPSPKQKTVLDKFTKKLL